MSTRRKFLWEMGAGFPALPLIDLLTRDIQGSTMSIRAQPIGSVFSRVPRIVRELETDTGKRVILTMSASTADLRTGTALLPYHSLKPVCDAVKLLNSPSLPRYLLSKSHQIF